EDRCVNRLLEGAARLLSRTDDDRRLLGDPAHEANSSRARLALALTLLATFATVLGPVYVGQMSGWGGFHPDIELARGDWRVLGPRKGALPCGEIAAAACPASPANPALWQSALNRASPGHEQRLRSWRWRDFWIGADIPVEKLQEALK